MSDDLIIGVDEAGRGAEVGPLVVAAVAIEASCLHSLLAGGMRDSKAVTPRARLALAGRIRAIAAWTHFEVRSAAVVDRYVGHPRKTLNLLEREMAMELLEAAPPAGRIIADGAKLFGALAASIARFEAIDHADEIFPVVMAAGLVAKVERERLLTDIDDQVASLVGRVPRRGYPGKETTAWIARYQGFFGAAPPEVRRSWYRRGPLVASGKSH